MKNLKLQIIKANHDLIETSMETLSVMDLVYTHSPELRELVKKTVTDIIASIHEWDKEIRAIKKQMIN